MRRSSWVLSLASWVLFSLAILGAQDPGLKTQDPGLTTQDPGLKTFPGFVHIPAATFTIGSTKATDPRAFENEQPEATIDVPGFYLGQREVTVAEFTKFAHATQWPVDQRALAGPADHPVTHVSWPDAIAYCRWLESTMKGSLPDGWRVQLPTEAQWEKAARGGDRRRYPWGDEPRRDRANFANQGTVAAGSIACPECAHGLLDMAGNVWEWTRSPYQAYPYDESNDRANLDKDALWVMRGGGFADGPELLRTTTRGAAEPGARRPFIGFRVAIIKN